MSKAAELANLIGNINAGGGGVNRNCIINGAMNVAQRGTSFTVTNEYGIDRWFCRENTDGALTFSQDTTSPDGFYNSLKVNVDSVDSSIGSSQFAHVAQRIEGFNIQPFAFGSSAAKTIVLSFYVRCSVTGKFGGSVTNGENNNRSFAFTYDINSANTWERKSVTIVGDTTGTWNVDNSQEMAVFWSLGAGSGHKKAEGSWDATASVQSASEASVELIGNASATWFITGVQLEVGQNPTEFEHEPFERTLAKCQRYLQTWGSTQAVGAGTWYSASQVIAFMPFREIMRDTPTMTTSGDNFAKVYTGSSNTKQVDDSSPFDLIKTTGTRMNLSVSSNGTAGHGAMVQTEGSGAFILADAEL